MRYSITVYIYINIYYVINSNCDSVCVYMSRHDVYSSAVSSAIVGADTPSQGNHNRPFNSI